MYELVNMNDKAKGKSEMLNKNKRLSEYQLHVIAFQETEHP
jgi:hypothetical protein